jgi:uncharacterized membrane protein YdcZ (DUF606 family)
MESRQKRRGFWPALVLLLLAPALAELLSGSAPPVEFFNPIGLLLMAALYGSGAILIRELRVRWRKAWWPTVFVLGAAYGIVEEGLACKSFFDPYWQDVGLLGSYGRWAGVNWVWSLDLTIYHMVFSIAIPILLVEVLFPALRDERWVGRKGMIGFSILLAADVLLCFALFPYRPSLLHILLAFVTAAALFLIAWRLPSPVPTPRQGPVRRPLWFALVGFFGIFAFFMSMWLLPELGVPVPLSLLVPVLLMALVAWLVRRMSRSGAWNDEHRGALAGGALMWLVLLAPIQELDATRPDNTTGMIVVGLAALLFLIWAWLRVRRRIRTQTVQPA